MVGIIIIDIIDFDTKFTAITSAAPGSVHRLPIVIGDIKFNIISQRGSSTIGFSNPYSKYRRTSVKSKNRTRQINQFAREVISSLTCHIDCLFPYNFTWSCIPSFSINNHIFTACSWYARPSQSQIIMSLTIIINTILALTNISRRFMMILSNKSSVTIGEFSINDKFMLSKN